MKWAYVFTIEGLDKIYGIIGIYSTFEKAYAKLKSISNNFKEKSCESINLGKLWLYEDPICGIGCIEKIEVDK